MSELLFPKSVPARSVVEHDLFVLGSIMNTTITRCLDIIPFYSLGNNRIIFHTIFFLVTFTKVRADEATTYIEKIGKANSSGEKHSTEEETPKWVNKSFLFDCMSICCPGILRLCMVFNRKQPRCIFDQIVYAFLRRGHDVPLHHLKHGASTSWIGLRFKSGSLSQRLVQYVSRISAHYAIWRYHTASKDGLTGDESFTDNPHERVGGSRSSSVKLFAEDRWKEISPFLMEGKEIPEDLLKVSHEKKFIPFDVFRDGHLLHSVYENSKNEIPGLPRSILSEHDADFLDDESVVSDDVMWFPFNRHELSCTKEVTFRSDTMTRGEFIESLLVRSGHHSAQHHPFGLGAANGFGLAVAGSNSLSYHVEYQEEGNDAIYFGKSSSPSANGSSAAAAGSSSCCQDVEEALDRGDCVVATNDIVQEYMNIALKTEIQSLFQDAIAMFAYLDLSPCQSLTSHLFHGKTLLFAAPHMEALAHIIAAHSNGSVMIGRIKFVRFEDSFPKLTIEHSNMLKYANVAFLASLHSPNAIFEQISVMMAIPRYLARTFQVILPYFPTGTMERITKSGEVATASTLSRILSTIPQCARGPSLISLFDLHTLQNQFYFSDQVHVRLESCVPLLISYLQRIGIHRTCTIAFPDEGARKRFQSLFQYHQNTDRIVTCQKVRKGKKRIVSVQSGHCEGQDVIIIDDLTRSGGTILECAKVLVNQYGAKSVSAFVTHGIFPQSSYKRFLYDPTEDSEPGQVRIKTFFLTDSHPQSQMLAGRHPFRVLSCAPVFLRVLDEFRRSHGCLAARRT